MKSIIKLGPAISEAHDASTAEAHQYFGQVDQWLKEQKESIEEIDQQAKKYGDEALAFRTMLKFVRSKNIIENLREK